jgi:YHS domain-containing protein
VLGSAPQGVQCPVCSLAFTPSAASAVVSLKGKDHHVCGSECARKLRSNPPRYGVSMQTEKTRGRR